MERQQTRSEDAAPGFIAGFAGLAKSGFALLMSRVELAALELGEVRNNIAKLLLVGALGIVALWFALGCWTALIIVLAWDAMGWKILLIVAAAYSLLALGILLYARTMLGSEQLSMPATMTELRKDRDALL
ncbi:MAG TPA: phage holin family protein [Noviherbaspirillum sp.]|uniref:phage holin family protein n=1 Tax=Noviherbaspirillum sp. TaxID=1926288 RepID=UPI002B469559|nr:phage holin family protein [Noviherbaspirillum sp.]HJV86442.1 phage holin family protein [Noviherbaspirillum sp.]